MITADDFGLSNNVNKGIISLLESNIISNASAMVCGGDFEGGINNLNSKFYKKLGLHICLDSDGIPISNIEDIPSLVDKNTGKFFTRAKFIYKIFTGQIDQIELNKEINLQYKKLLDYGIKPNHIDGHGHIHVIPQVADVICSLAKK